MKGVLGSCTSGMFYLLCYSVYTVTPHNTTSSEALTCKTLCTCSHCLPACAQLAIIGGKVYSQQPLNRMCTGRETSQPKTSVLLHTIEATFGQSLQLTSSDESSYLPSRYAVQYLYMWMHTIILTSIYLCVQSKLCLLVMNAYQYKDLYRVMTPDATFLHGQRSHHTTVTFPVEGCGLRQCITYGRADRRENGIITFELSAFSKIHESKTLQLPC